ACACSMETPSSTQLLSQGARRRVWKDCVMGRSSGLGSCCEEMAVSDGSAGACPCVRRTAVVMAADLWAAAFEKKNAGPGLIQARRITLSGDVACRDGSELEAGVQVVLA